MGRVTLISSDAALFLQRRVYESLGIALMAFGGILIACLLSYNGLDPSFSTASLAAPTNFLGIPGAYIADMLFLILGWSAYLPPLVCGFFGWHLLRHSHFFTWPQALWWTLLLLSLGSCLCSLIATDSHANGGLLGYTLTEGMHHLFGAPKLLVALIVLGVVTTLSVMAAMTHLGPYLVQLWQLKRAQRQHTADMAPLVHPEAFPEDFTLPPEPEPSMTEEPSSILKRPLPRAARPPQEAQPGLFDTLPTKEKLSPGQGLDRHTHLPSIGLLQMPPPAQTTQEPDAKTAQLLEAVLEEFGIKGRIVQVRTGPVVTLYELEPSAGTKSSRVIGLSDDIARSMCAISARISIIPGRNAIGIELPNATRQTVYLRELLTSPGYINANAHLALALGKDISGTPVVADLARMPHLLLAGTTGSGKSVAVNTMILSLLYRLSPQQCRFIMIDPKMLELSIYDGIPHLLSPVVTDPRKAVVALKWTVREMEERYRAMSSLGVRNIEGYNLKLTEASQAGLELTRKVQTGFDPDSGKPIIETQPLDLTPLPYIVVVVDEMADLMLVAGKDIESAVQRLAQMARAAGIHLIMATQRPSVDVITGTIKANFPCRISFQVTSKIDSRTILSEQGAEQLLGQGDMLYMASAGRVTRVHGPFVSDREVEAVVNALKQLEVPQELIDITQEDDLEGQDGKGSLNERGAIDPLFDQAVALICREKKASTSFIQRYFQIGYNRAARIMDQMEAEHIVSAANAVGKREILARVDD
jgi:S-DNA-T family DNA segregation ATPase FtsK/SpoIIIE